MASSRGFLFINKDSRSPSLSRNTGSEAALASKVNKHVQQQRFWKSSGPRKNWYRPFVRSNSSGPSSTPSPSQSCFAEERCYNSRSPSHASIDQQVFDSPHRSSTPRRTSSIARKSPRSVPSEAVIKHESSCTSNLEFFDPIFSLATRPGDAVDPFNNTVVPITSALRDVLSRHLRWVVSSSITEFAIHEGIRRIFTAIMTSPMHSSAFLAMATAQQRKTAGVLLPHEESPEHYSYEATKMIRQHLASNGNKIDPYTFVDIFRLAMCEWLNGNHKAARIHFAYLAQHFDKVLPKDWGEQHNLEVISSEDIFLAIDIDEAPLLKINWEPELPIGASSPLALESVPNEKCTMMKAEPDSRLLSPLPAQSLTRNILQQCLTDLKALRDSSNVDFACATSGFNWIIKRRLHATMHRLQSFRAHNATVEESIRRSTIILLLLTTTTPARRVGRTNVPRLATRLRRSMLALRTSRTDTRKGKTTADDNRPPLHKTEPALWLWMCIIGLLAVQDCDPTFRGIDDTTEWFLQQAKQTTLQMIGPLVTPNELKDVLSDYLYFENPLGVAVRGNIAMIQGGQLCLQGGLELTTEKFEFSVP